MEKFLVNEKEVEIPVSANSSMNLPTMDIPGMPGSQMGMINLGDVFGKNFGKQLIKVAEE